MCSVIYTNLKGVHDLNGIMVLLVGTGYIGWVIYRNGRTYFRYKKSKKYQTTHHLTDSDLEMYQRIMDELKTNYLFKRTNE